MGISDLSCRLEGGGTVEELCGHPSRVQNCPQKLICGIKCFVPVTSLRRDKGPLAPLNLVTRAETDLSVSRNQELENMRSSTLDRRCQKGLGLQSNYWAAQGGKEDILALEPQIRVLEMAGTLKRGTQTVFPQALGPLGMQGGGEHGVPAPPMFQSPTVLSFIECS